MCVCMYVYVWYEGHFLDFSLVGERKKPPPPSFISNHPSLSLSPSLFSLLSCGGGAKGEGEKWNGERQFFEDACMCMQEDEEEEEEVW